MADNMKSAIKMAWEHGGADFQSRFDKSTGQAEQMKEGALTRPMNIFEALAILESAVLECKKRNVNTPDATEALDLLAPYFRPNLVVAQFRHHIARDNDHEKEGQRQVLRATFPSIRNSVKELIGTEMDALARDFPDMHDMEVKNAIEYLAREYDRLGEPWVFNSAPTET
jgi:hypothetical protein